MDLISEKKAELETLFFKFNFEVSYLLQPLN